MNANKSPNKENGTGREEPFLKEGFWDMTESSAYSRRFRNRIPILKLSLHRTSLLSTCIFISFRVMNRTMEWSRPIYTQIMEFESSFKKIMVAFSLEKNHASYTMGKIFVTSSFSGHTKSTYSGVNHFIKIAFYDGLIHRAYAEKCIQRKALNGKKFCIET